MAEKEELNMKDVKFKMRTRIVLKICPNEVMAIREKKCRGREDVETTELSDGTFLNFRNKVWIEKQGCQQHNADV
jgi:hypothetical protein